MPPAPVLSPFQEELFRAAVLLAVGDDDGAETSRPRQPRLPTRKIVFSVIFLTSRKSGKIIVAENALD